MTTTPNIKFNITADTSQAVKALNELKAALPAVKAGWRSTEFWLVALTVASSIVSVLFHRTLNLGGQEQAWALLASGVASSVYAISRAHLKKPVSLAAVRYDLGALRDPATSLVADVQRGAAIAKGDVIPPVSVPSVPPTVSS